MNISHNLTLKDAAAQLNITVGALRGYLNRGYIPYVRRDQKGHRILSLWQVDLLAILLGMKQAGFTSKELRRYSRLFREGKKTESERLAMLTTHKHQLRNTIENCERAIDFIERQEEIAKQHRP